MSDPNAAKDDEFSAMSCEQLQQAVNDQYARFPCITKDELDELGRMQQEFRVRCPHNSKECSS